MMRLKKIAGMAVVTVTLGMGLGACANVGDAQPGLSAQAPFGPDAYDAYSAAALANKDYAAAVASLEAMDSTDPLVQLNLALAYRKTDRVDEAMRLYRSILDGKANPYAVIDDKKAPRRIKGLAEAALQTLEAAEQAKTDDGR